MTVARDSAALPICINVTAHIDERYGGLATSVPEFSDAVASTGHYHSKLLAFCETGERLRRGAERSTVTVLKAGRLRWSADPLSSRRFGASLGMADVVHAHGLWQEQSRISAAWARKHQKPLVVSAHGMLDRWALRAGWLKKAVYWRAIERTNLAYASCLRALTTSEAQQYRDMGLRNPIAVVPNGVSVPKTVTSESFLLAFPQLRGMDIVLFLGRIHPKKGIDILLEAWGSARRKFANAQLVIAGPGYEEMQPVLRGAIERHQLAGNITFTGMLRDDLKWSALAAARVFVLPSYSEGFSVAALEALGVGTPVIVSTQCYFPEVSRVKCGWIIRPSADELTNSLDTALRQNSSEHQEMGRRGQQLVSSEFSWAAVGRKAVEVFDWIRIGKQPVNVEIFA
jgi:glycosyltransferase involved in cell wall biosynthesis